MMDVEKIGTNSLDLELEKFLTPFKTDGRDVQYGVLLVKRMEKSRPRPANGPPGPYQHPDLEITTYRATERPNLAGVFTLISTSQLDTRGWMKWLAQLLTANSPDIDLADFIGLMKFVAPFGNQCPCITMSTHSNPGLRPDLGIKQNPVAGADAAFRAKSNSKEFQSPWTQVNSMGSPLHVQMAFAQLTLTVYHHRGQPFKWVVVPPNQKLNFEAAVRREFQEEIGAQECAQFAHHLSLWISPERLRLWKITFFEVTQNEGNLLFLFPASYFWGYSTGYNVLEWKYHAGEHWTCSNYNFCNVGYSLCGKTHQGKMPLYVQSTGEQDLNPGDDAREALVPALKRRKRPRKSHMTTPLFEEVMDFSDLYSTTGTKAPIGMAPTGHQTRAESNIRAEGNTAANQDSVAHPLSDGAENQLVQLLQENYNLSQENQTLRQTNQDLGSRLQQTSSQREANLRVKLQDTASERDQYRSILRKRDNTLKEREERIKVLEAHHSEAAWIKEEIEAARAERDSLRALQKEMEGYISNLEDHSTRTGYSIPWKDTAMNTYHNLSANVKRIAQLEQLLLDNKVPIPRSDESAAKE